MRKKVEVVWACDEKRRGIRGAKSGGVGRTEDEEEGQVKATMDG